MKAERILTIARLTVRDATRSRLLVSLGALLMIGIVGLPLLIRGDGTLAGRLHVILHYSMRFAVAVLSVATLWAACAGIALETQDRRLFLILARPVRRHEIWAGKWLAVVALNTILLGLAGAAIYGTLQWSVHTAAASPSERRTAADAVLTVCLMIPPRSDIADAFVQERFAALAQAGRIPTGLRRQQALATIRRDLLRQAYAVAPGQSQRWTFVLSRAPTADQPLSLRFRFASSRPERSAVRGLWRIGPPTAPNREEVTQLFYPDRFTVLAVPRAAVAPDNSVTVDFTNTEAQAPATVLFEPDGGIEFLVRQGTFGANFVRALLVALFQLAFLAAIGLTMGSLLSMPVAVFVSFAVLIVLALGGYIETVVSTGVFYVPHEGPLPAFGRLDALIKGLYHTLAIFTRPIAGLDAVPFLDDGRYLAWRTVGYTFVLLGGLYSGCAAAFGILLFRRREIGLAG